MDWRVRRIAQERCHRSSGVRGFAAPYFASRLSSSFLAGVQRIFATAELVEITERITACRDPTDDKFLELATSGRADVIVTGDLDLLVLSPFRGIPIVTPRVFIHEQQRNA
jgi:predicted nucleic acid-binding protein